MLCFCVLLDALATRQVVPWIPLKDMVNFELIDLCLISASFEDSWLLLHKLRREWIEWIDDYTVCGSATKSAISKY